MRGKQESERKLKNGLKSNTKIDMKKRERKAKEKDQEVWRKRHNEKQKE